MFNPQFIPKIKINPEKVRTSTIDHDFHHINKDGKLTRPWLNFDAIQKRNISQKNVFTFSATTVSHDFHEVDKENYDTVLESVTELVPVTTEDKEDLLVVHKKKVTTELLKKQASSSRDIQYETNDDHIKKERTNEPVKQPKVLKKTIKIPFSTFVKIHNFRYPPISSEANTNSAPQIEAPVEQGIMSQSEHNLEMENILELGAPEDKLEIKHTNEPANHPKVPKKTIKMPLSHFRKIPKIRFSSILPNVNSSRNHQPETRIEQEIGTQSEQKKEKEDIIAPDATVANSNDGNQNNREDFEANRSNKLNGQTETRLRKLKIPFSIFTEIDNFLHPPIFGSTVQNTFKFINASDDKSPQLDTKFFDTITYYHEQPYCHLIGFKSHELIFFTDDKSVERESKKQKDCNRAVAVPIHDSLSIKEGKTNNVYPNHKYVNTRVPVVIGEYNMEVCLDEKVLFEESVYQVKEISKVVELTNCKFVPTKFSPVTDSRDRIALIGTLFIEGNIHQSIEYIPIAKEEQPLHQSIVIELLIQLLQVQTVINQQLSLKENL